MPITNYTEYFRSERDIYCQNITSSQVSVTFEVGPGQTESYLFTNSRDPVNLTRHVPFNAIKSSMDLRKMLNRSPPALQLITEEEFMAYYNKAAKSNNVSVDAAMAAAERKRVSAQNHQPLSDAPPPIKIHEVVEDGKHLGDKKTVKSLDGMIAAEEEINPRVLHLCLQVHTSLPDSQKISAQTFLSELDTLNELTVVDWDYIQAHCPYKSVRNLARKKVAELTVGDEIEDEVVEVPAPKPVKKKPVKKAVPPSTPQE